jgi:hypothetical protein
MQQKKNPPQLRFSINNIKHGLLDLLREALLTSDLT